MSKKGKIKLDIGTRSFYMDGVKRSGGYIQEETKAVNGILRNISGKAGGDISVQRQDRSVGEGLSLGCSKREREERRSISRQTGSYTADTYSQR